MSETEEKVRDFYDRFGWKQVGGGRGEDVLFREFSPAYYRYHKSVEKRTLGCFDGLTESVLLAGCGDLPQSHVDVARRFDAIKCLDISEEALKIAEDTLGESSVYLKASILDIPLPDNSVDAAYCAHVIYHIHADDQEQAVRELIRVVRPGGRVVLLYSNPGSKIAGLVRLKNRIPLLRRWRRAPRAEVMHDDARPGLYFHPNKLAWWDQFGDQCEVRLLPWDAMSCDQDRELLKYNWFARAVYGLCSVFERCFPKTAVRWWTYPIVRLEKKSEG